MKKRALTLLTGLLALGTASYAFDGSIMHEFRYEDRNRTGARGDEQIEWTLAKGGVNLTDRIRFDFDVDRDIFLKDGSKTGDGWDIATGVNIKGGTLNMLGHTWQNENYLGFEYDASEFQNKKYTGNMEAETENYYVSPRLHTQLTEETWVQIDPRFTRENTTDDYYLDLRIQAATDWNNGWDNYLEVYNHIGGDDQFGENYSLDVENYLAYTKQVWGPIYSWTEFGVEAYDMANSSTDATVSVYADPQIQYRTEVGEVDIKAYVGYTMYEGDNNFQQLESGVAFGTKF